MIRILVTGGTFDKEYDEVRGRLFFKDTHVQEMLDKGRSRVPVSIRTLMMIDSLEMTDADRALVVEQCRQSEVDRIVVTHGTDTMVETARAIAAANLAGRHACRIVGIERNGAFVRESVRRFRQHGLGDRVRIVQANGRHLPIRSGVICRALSSAS